MEKSVRVFECHDSSLENLWWEKCFQKACFLLFTSSIGFLAFSQTFSSKFDTLTVSQTSVLCEQNFRFSQISVTRVLAEPFLGNLLKVARYTLPELLLAEWTLVAIMRCC